MKTIKEKNFLLRPLKMSDAESIAKYANDRNVSKGLVTMPYPYTVDFAKKWLKKALREGRKKTGTRFRWVIEIDGEAVGIISLHVNKEKWKKHSGELGYWLGKKYWGRGIMIKAAGEITKFGFEKMCLKRIWAPVFSFNKASARVLEKNGYKLEGLMKKDTKKKGRYLDTYIYAKVR